MEPEREIERLQRDLEQAKNLRIRAETQLEHLQQEERSLLQELAELGVDPEGLDAEVERLDREIERLLAEARRLIPADLAAETEEAG